MYCTQCGYQLEDQARFCSQCSHPTGRPVPRPVGTHGGLMLPAEGKKIAGVCAGFARYLDADVALVRIIWLTLALSTGIGFIAYVIAWIMMPKEPMIGVSVDPTTQVLQQS